MTLQHIAKKIKTTNLLFIFCKHGFCYSLIVGKTFQTDNKCNTGNSMKNRTHWLHFQRRHVALWIRRLVLNWHKGVDWNRTPKYYDNKYIKMLYYSHTLKLKLNSISTIQIMCTKYVIFLLNKNYIIIFQNNWQKSNIVLKKEITLFTI